MTAVAGFRHLLSEYLHPASIKRRLLQALSLGDPPEKIALGVAVGVFLGVFPTFYLGIILAALGSRLFRYNLAGAIAGSAVSTPLTSPFIMAASAVLGSFITGVDWGTVLEQIKAASAALGSLPTGVDWGTVLEQIKWEQLWAVAWAAVLTYMAGNLILCALSSLPAYFITRRAVVEYRRRRGAGS